MMNHDWDNQWIINHFKCYKTTKELHRTYLETHNDQISYDTFKWHCRVNLGLHRKAFRLNDEHKDFICKHFDEMSVENLRRLFNKTFNTNFKTTAFNYHTKKFGLNKWKEHEYTDEQEEFLREYAPMMTRRQLLQNFNEQFDCSLKEDALVMHCWQRGYGALNDGRFSTNRPMMIFIDGNQNNFDPDNIQNVDLETFGFMRSNGWLNSDEKIVRAGLLWCRLFKEVGI